MIILKYRKSIEFLFNVSRKNFKLKNIFTQYDTTSHFAKLTISQSTKNVFNGTKLIEWAPTYSRYESNENRVVY